MRGTGLHHADSLRMRAALASPCEMLRIGRAFMRRRLRDGGIAMTWNCQPLGRCSDHRGKDKGPSRLVIVGSCPGSVVT